MAIKPFLRVYPGTATNNYYLPGVDPTRTSQAWSKAIPGAAIPLQDGETVYTDGITLQPQKIRLSGVIYRAAYPDADEMAAAIAALEAGVGITATGDAARMTFGRYDTDTTADLEWNDHAYVTGFSINGEPGLEYTGTNDCEWSLDIEIARPDLWHAAGETEDPGASSDEIVLVASSRIVIVVNDMLLFKDSAGNLKGQFSVGDGNLKVSGDYGFLP